MHSDDISIRIHRRFLTQLLRVCDPGIPPRAQSTKMPVSTSHPIARRAPRSRSFHALISGLVIVSVLAGCTTLPRHSAPVVAADNSQGIATEVDSCRALLQASRPIIGSELDSSDIQVPSWNIKKGSKPGWLADLHRFADNSNLVLIQEASLERQLTEQLGEARYWSFAPGFRSRNRQTGVMTVSSARPLARCNLTNLEPWLRTRKATSITEYGMTNTEETLLVVNIHAVNFAFGLRDFERQILQVQTVIASHEGPVILAGDFNTWRRKRGEIVDSVAATLGLTSLRFDQDHRSKAFGQFIDHVYVRGLNVSNATTQLVVSSDHNPISVRLSM